MLGLSDDDLDNFFSEHAHMLYTAEGREHKEFSHHHYLFATLIVRILHTNMLERVAFAYTQWSHHIDEQPEDVTIKCSEWIDEMQRVVDNPFLRSSYKQLNDADKNFRYKKEHIERITRIADAFGMSSICPTPDAQAYCFDVRNIFFGTLLDAKDETKNQAFWRYNPHPAASAVNDATCMVKSSILQNHAYTDVNYAAARALYDILHGAETDMALTTQEKKRILVRTTRSSPWWIMSRAKFVPCFSLRKR